MRPSRVVIDTCVWISAYIESEANFFRARALLDEVHRGRHRVVLPECLLTELVCRLAIRFRENHRDPVDAIRLGERLLAFRSITWLHTSRQFCVDAAELGARHRLRGFDALLAQSAVQSRFDLLTTDTDFQKSSIAKVIMIRGLE